MPYIYLDIVWRCSHSTACLANFDALRHRSGDSYRLTARPLLSRKSPKRDAIRTLVLVVGHLGRATGEHIPDSSHFGPDQV